MRREFSPKQLIALATYLDTKGLTSLAQKIDNLRMKLEQVKLNPAEFIAESRPTSTREMLEVIPEEKIEKRGKARVPFGVKYEEVNLAEELTKLLKWAKKEVKGGKWKATVIKEAKIKAKEIIEDSYKKLNQTAKEHSKERTKKTVKISPEEKRRLDTYKKNSLQDFIKILKDSLK